VSERAFEEYRLHTLTRSTTLHDRETKRVASVRAEGVRAQRIYVYDGTGPTTRSTPAATGLTSPSRSSCATAGRKAQWILVVEHLYRWINWEIVEASAPLLKTDSQAIEFRIQVPAGEEKAVTYRVHYTW
jgi:hypothetical protein